MSISPAGYNKGAIRRWPGEKIVAGSPYKPAKPLLDKLQPFNNRNLGSQSTLSHAIPTGPDKKTYWM